MDDYRKEEDYEGYFPEGTVHMDEYFYMGDYNFVWDKAKNATNLREHGIDFRTAVLAFNDPYALEEKDVKHSGYEERKQLTGMPVDEDDVLDFPGFEGVPRALMGEIDNVLFIIYVERFVKNDEYIRLISARAALKPEIDAYKKKRAKLDRR